MNDSWRTLKTKLGLIAAVIMIFLAGVGVSAVIFSSGNNQAQSAFQIREQTTDYQFIKPLLSCEVGDKKEFDEYLKLEKKINGLISNFKKDRKINSASVYFRDLQSGRWTGVNEDEKYSPASLHKVSLMIAYLKKAEANIQILDQKIVFEGSLIDEPADHPSMKVGQSYTIAELLYRLIVYSDNDAKDILHSYINQDSFNDVFSDLGFEPPSIKDIGDTMSSKDYSRFFRTLYSATYLSRPMSEVALDILSKTEFKNGIVAGLPPDLNLSVAHKYGYRVFPEPVGFENITKEVHDCGIIYYEKNPYFLCVMTKGWNNIDLKMVIQEISRVVFNEIRS